MKKIVILTFSILLCTIMSVYISAATVTTQTNTSESTAATLEMGDTGVIYGELDSCKYYKVNIPSNGILTLNGELVTTVLSNNDTRYVFQIYNSSFSGNFYNFYFQSYKLYTSHESVSVQLPKGTYYIAIEGSYSFGSHVGYPPTKNMTLYLTPSFQCSHISTDTTITKQPTCSETGTKVTKCSECKEIIETVTLNKLPHTDGTEWTTLREATCSQKGEKVLYCTVCGEVSTKEDIEKLPHSYGDWVTDRETSCSKAGLRSRVCSVCNAKDEEEIKKLDHIYSSWTTTKNATCTQEGEKVRTCSVCKYEEKEKIAKAEHKWGEWKTEKEASETSQGSEFRICSSCYQTEEKTIPKLIHGEKFEWEEVVKVTCTENGLLSKFCLYCDKRIESKTIVAEGHDFTDWILVKDPPSRTQPGKEVRNCKNCKHEETRDVWMTHGEYGTWQITKEATCNEMGQKTFICYCCSKVTETENIPKLTHKFSEWTESVKALPEKDGTLSRACSLCGKTEEMTEKYSFSTLKTKTKIVPNFKDVASNAWYKDVVTDCYHYSLMLGNSETTFNPTGNITIAEVITAAVRIYCLNNTYASKPTMNTTPWYKGYVDYAISKNIIKADDFSDYTLPATRAEMAYILKNCVTSSKLKKINTITSIPDVTKEDKYGEEIFKLYEAGILGGSDEKGTFFPDRSITRAEGAAIIARLSEISDRIKK